MTVQLRPHQHAAVTEAVDVLRAGTAGTPHAATIVMATGSGKTMVAWHTATMLGCSTVVVAAPTTALVDQLAADAARLQIGQVLCVSSKSSQRSTLDQAEIVDHLRGAGEAAGTGPDAMRLVITTYASLPVVATACRAAALTVDLLVADEAHRTCGPSAGPAAGAHTFPTARRLYMTATPRVYERHSDDWDGASMDDDSVFGRRVVDLDLASAIEAGIVADYRVVVAVVDRRTLRTLDQLAPGSDPRMVAGAVATVRAMRAWQMRSVLSFHSRVHRSREFAEMIGAVARGLDRDERPVGPGYAAWVAGSTPAADRDRALSRLGTSDGWAVVSSARCLSEGIDVPAVDGIAFCDPKTSSVDVAQAVGRALRPADGKVATIVLPVLTDGETIDASGTAIAGTVLRILRGHDRRLGARLDQARRLVGRAEVTATSLDDRITFVLPPGVPAAISERLRLDLVREATCAWDEMFGLLQAWVDDHGHAGIPQAETVTRATGEPVGLGHWCTGQRTLYRRGHLAVDREAALESLPGWTWVPLDDRFSRQYAALAAYVDEHGRYPTAATVHLDVKVGQFVNVVRTSYSDGALTPERTEALEALPGWVWNERDAAWDGWFAHLAAFTARAGHARPSSTDADTVAGLGRWVSKQRVKYRDGTLRPDRASQLETLTGWVWHERDAAWELGYETLRTWVAAHGAAISQDAVVGGFRLGAWVAKQRGRYAAGTADPARSARLEELPGWEWRPADAQIESRFGQIDDFVAAHGHPHIVESDDPSLAAWVGTQRRLHRRGQLPDDRVTRLEAIPGWQWDAAQARRLRRRTELDAVEDAA
jgi:superfamily II DNA or RNA helicase